MADTALTNPRYSVELDKIYTVFDHDGNVHPGDIGQDYFVDLLDFEDRQEFVDEVRALRQDERAPADGVYREQESHSDAEELAIFIAEHRLDSGTPTRKDVEERARAAVEEGYDENFRDGFPTFINDLAEAGTHPLILSAGDQTFLRRFYSESELIETSNGVELNSDSDLHIVGSGQNWAQSGIEKGCGNRKKPIRYEEALNLINGVEKPMLYSGDSSSDRRSLLRADLGMATGKGAQQYADVVVKEDPNFEQKDTWYGQAGVTIIYAGLVQGLDEDTIIDDTATYVSELADDPGDIHDIQVESGDNDHLQYLNQTYGEVRPGEKIADLWEQVKDSL